MDLITRNPTTGEIIQTYPTMTTSDIETIIAACHKDALAWSQNSF